MSDSTSNKSTVSLRGEFVQGSLAGAKIGAVIGSLGFAEGPITSPMTCGYIIQALTLFPGDYIETGTRYGGSAILAALFAKSVITIDPAHEEEFKKVIAEAKSDVVEKITRIGKKAEEVKKLPKRKYTVGFIDGSHEYDDVLIDFYLFKDRVSNFLIFDDVDLPGVYAAIETIVSTQDVWRLVAFQHPTTAVFAKNFNLETTIGAF